jgi:sugar phosphate isomerase/epimerase
MPIPISVQLWSLREQMKDGRHEAVLHRLAEVGYRGVECGNLFGLAPAAFRALVESCGLAVTGYHGGMPAPEKARAVAEIARALGLDHVTFAYTPPERWASVESIAKLADEVEASRAALAKHDVKLVYHNHDHEIRPVAGRMGLAHLLERVPGLLMEIDTYWAANFGAQDPALVVTQFRARTPLLHIKDGPFVKGQPHLAVGSGRMDIPRVIAAADPSVTKWLVVELDECGGDMWQAVVDSCRYLVGKGLAERALARK